MKGDTAMDEGTTECRILNERKDSVKTTDSNSNSEIGGTSSKITVPNRARNLGEAKQKRLRCLY